MGKAANALASSSFIAGLFLGIYLLTGTSIDPIDLASMVGSAIIGQLSHRYSVIWGAILVVIAIVGVWQTITLIASGLAYGIKGLVMTSGCFFGGLLLVFSPVVGIILLLVGYIVAFIS